MKRILVAVAMVGMMAGTAWADGAVHHNNNTTIHNNNHGGQGGQGGAGGTGVGIGIGKGGNASSNANSRSSVKSSNKLENTNVGINSQGQEQGQGQEMGQQIINFTPASAPSIGIPGLAVAPETCMGSTAAGISAGTGMISLGVGFGQTWVSEPCNLRMFSRRLQELGLNDAAVLLLAEDARVRRVLEQTGVLKPVSAEKSDKQAARDMYDVKRAAEAQ